MKFWTIRARRITHHAASKAYFLVGSINQSTNHSVSRAHSWRTCIGNKYLVRVCSLSTPHPLLLLFFFILRRMGTNEVQAPTLPTHQIVAPSRPSSEAKLREAIARMHLSFTEHLGCTAAACFNSSHQLSGTWYQACPVTTGCIVAMI